MTLRLLLKKSVLLLFLCVFCSAAAFADNSDGGSSVSKDGYTLVFSTETAATAGNYLTLSTAEQTNCTGSFSDLTTLEQYWEYCPTWSTVQWTHNMSSDENERSRNISFENGTAKLYAKKNSDAGGWLTSGIQTTEGFQYGIFEFKAKCKKMEGNFPALWMMPVVDDSRGWPYGGEIDIMEIMGNTYSVDGTVHCATCKCVSGQSGNYTSSTTADANYHIYTLKWDENGLTWYKDGTQFYQYLKSQHSTEYPFDKPFYIIVNQSMLWGDYTASNEYEMDVAYVRVFQKTDNYNISCNATNGTVTSSSSVAAAGETITLTTSPNQGYKLGTLTVTGTTGAVDITSAGNNMYSFTMPAGTVTVIATFVEDESGSGSGSETTTGTTFRRKTSGSIDTSKKYLIVYEKSATEAILMKSSFESAKESQYARAILGVSGYTINNHVIETDESNAIRFVASSTSGQYYLANNAGTYYCGTTSAQEYLEVSTSGMSHTIGFDTSDGHALIVSRNSELKFSPTAGAGAYTGFTGLDGFYYNAIEKVYLYEQVTGTTPTLYNVTVSASTNGTVTASTATAAAGEMVTLRLAPADGYMLNTLTVSGATVRELADGTYTFTMPSSNVTVTATFKEKPTVDALAEGVYAIKISGSTLYVDMATTITETDNKAECLTMQAKAYPIKVTPASAENTYTMQDKGAGTGYIGAISTGWSLISQTDSYTWTLATDDGTVYTIARPDGKFIGYDTATEGKGLYHDKSTGGKFEFVPMYSVTCATSANGSVSSDATYNYSLAGATITLSSTPNAGYELDGYLVDGVAITGNTFTMPAKNVTVSATFKKTAYTITVTQPTGGTITASATSAVSGTEITLTNSPAAEYTFGSYVVKDASGNTVAVNNGKFTMPSSNVTVTATFTATTYNVTINSTNGTVTATPNPAAAGATVTLTVTPNSGYELATLTVTNASGQAVNVTDNKFTMPSGGATVTATYNKLVTYNVTVQAVTGGTVTATPTTAVAGATITLSNTPETDYTFVSYSVKDASGNDVTVTNNTFTMPASNVLVSASFKTTKKIFKLKTSGTIDTSKKYLIVYQTSETATSGIRMNSNFTSNTANGTQGAAGSSVTISSQQISTDEANAFTFETTSTAGTYYIKNNSGYYFGNTSTSNQYWFHVSTSKSDAVSHTVTFSNNKVLIKGNTQYTGHTAYYLEYNTSSSVFDFCDDHSDLIYLYEEDGESETTPTRFVLKGSGDIDTSKNYLFVCQDGLNPTSGTMMRSDFITDRIGSDSDATRGVQGVTVNIENNIIETSESNSFTFSTVTGETGKYFIKNNVGYYIGSHVTESEVGDQYLCVTTTPDDDDEDDNYYNSLEYGDYGNILISSKVGTPLLYDNNIRNNAQLFFYGGWNIDGTFRGLLYLYEQIGANDHLITCETEEGGLVAAYPAFGPSGTVITLSTHPEAGHAFDSYVVKTASGTEITVNNGKFTMPDEDVVITSTWRRLPLTISKYGWSTFYLNHPFVMPEGVTGVVISSYGQPEDIDFSLDLVYKYPAGSVVPAKTPILVKDGLTGESHTYEYSLAEEGTGTAPDTNWLRGQMRKGMIAPEQKAEDTHYYYKLTTGTSEGKNGVLGFFWGADGGDEFYLKGDNRSYLVVPRTASASAMRFNFDGEVPDDIHNLELETWNMKPGTIYNLAGQRISTPVRGQIYIMNGQKFIAK